MPGLYSFQHRSAGEVITAAKYNGDHQTHIDGHVPDLMDGLSADVSEMQATTDPGEPGSEVLATDIAGEFRRLRHMLAAITGGPEWYSPPARSIMLSGVDIDDDSNLYGYGTPISFRTDDFTLASSDRGKVIDCEKNRTLTVTIPDGFPVGYTVTLVQSGGAVVLVEGESGVTVRCEGTPRTRGRWSTVTVYKHASDEWIVVGDVAT